MVREQVQKRLGALGSSPGTPRASPQTSGKILKVHTILKNVKQ